MKIRTKIHLYNIAISTLIDFNFLSDHSVVGGVIAGAVIAFIIFTVLPIVIPICICICLEVGVGAACRDSNRPRTTRVVATAAPPQPTATVITPNTSTLQKNEYLTQPVPYPANLAHPPYSDKSPYPEAGGYAPPYPDLAAV